MGSSDRTRIKHRFSDAFRARYRIERVLGTGGTAVVYLATQVELRRAVALKVLDAVGFEEGDAAGRFEDEARLSSRLDHPNLCRLFEYGRDGAYAYLVYEFVEGTDLARRIRECKDTPRKGLELEEALRVLGDVARGLEYAHKLAVVHRDLKPANILLGEDGVSKVTDFGLAKMQGMTREIRTETGMVVGTPECMAPEQAMGQAVGTPADIYALGCLLFWMLAGRPPFEDESAGKVMIAHVKERFPRLDQLRPNLGSGVYRLLDELVRRDPAARPSATEVLRALKVLDQPVRGRSEDVESALASRKLKLVPASRRGPGRWVGAALGGAALLGAAVWLTPRARPEAVEVALAPRRVRVTWRGPAAVLELRPADQSRGWEQAPGVAGPAGVAAEVAGLSPGEEYEWRFQDGYAQDRGRFRTPEVVEIEGPWPRYDERGNPVGWLLRPAADVTLSLADGAKARVRADGLAEVEPGRYQVHYRGGLSEEAEDPGTPPNLQGGLQELLAALREMNMRGALFAAKEARRRGDIPTLAARRAVSAEYSRWKGIEPALREVIPSLQPETRVALYAALDRAQGVDRALRNEGLTPVFDVQEYQARCLALTAEARALTPGEGPGVRLVTERQWRTRPEYEYDTPPTIPVPEGSGDLTVHLRVADLWADRYLEVELGGPGSTRDPVRVPVRPRCRDFRFEGSLTMRFPEALLAGRPAVRVHLRTEELPGLVEDGASASFPFIDASRGPTLQGPPAAQLLRRELAR